MGKKKTSKALLRAIHKYDERTAYKKSLKFNLETDYDIVRKLESVENFQAYIKKLIRDDINKV